MEGWKENSNEGKRKGQGIEVEWSLFQVKNRFWLFFMNMNALSVPNTGLNSELKRTHNINFYTHKIIHI